MKYLKILFTFIFLILLSTVTICINAQTTASATEIAEIQKLLDKIKELKDAGKANDDAEIVKLANEAIVLTDKYYKIPDDNLADKDPPGVGKAEPEYDPTYNGDGKASKSGKKVKVKLGLPAFSSPGWLASTKKHEIVVHGGQAATDRWYNDAKGDEINEVEAYDGELADSTKSGLSQAEIAELLKRRKEHFDELDAANKKKIEDAKEDGKPYELGLIAPRDGKEKRAVIEKEKIYVAGNVLSGERMKVTFGGGTKTVSGMVVQAEVNGKKTETRTDANGSAIIDFAVIAAGITAPVVAIIRTLDAKGNEIASANTTCVPGNSNIFNRPEISELPNNLANGDVVTIPGQNLGADAQLVCGEQIQETLSASDNELTVFMDSKTGEQPFYVITANGVSESQNVNIYSLDFVLPKSSISPKEVVPARVHYESIPVGTKLIFTNQSPQTVKMTIPGGQTIGNTCTYTVTNRNATIPVNVTGITKGSFTIALDMKFEEKQQRKN